jgi:hypothetical protein
MSEALIRATKSAIRWSLVNVLSQKGNLTPLVPGVQASGPLGAPIGLLGGAGGRGGGLHRWVRRGHVHRSDQPRLTPYHATPGSHLLREGGSGDTHTGGNGPLETPDVTFPPLSTDAGNADP